jgi:subtilisin family serine protease
MRIKQVFAITLFLILFLNIFSFTTLSDDISIKKSYSILDSKNYFDGYIIEFVEDSLLEFKNVLRKRINDFIIKFSDSSKDSFLKTQIQNHKDKLITIQNQVKAEILKLLGSDDTEIFSSEFFEVFNGISIKNIPEEIIQKIKDIPNVKDVLPNTKITAQLDESVPLINAAQTWKCKDSLNRNLTGKGITIAFLDTGVNYLHPDLLDNYISNGSFDFVNNDTDPMDDNGHGTHVAGIACGTGKSSNYRYVGVAPNAKFYSMKILDESGSGDLETFIAGMQRALDPNNDGNTSDHVDIISLSIGTEQSGDPNDKFCQIVDELVEEGIVVVIAAGNNGPETQSITSPGCSIKGITVGSVNKNDEISYSSSRGPIQYNGEYISKPDLVAPGVKIFSCDYRGGYRYDQGTSMATPHVAGAVALLLQANPNYSPKEVKNILKDNAKNLHLDNNIQGAGRIDILNPFLSENILFTKFSSEITEGDILRISLRDKQNNYVKAWILVTIPFHLPRLKFGSDVNFITPFILSKETDFLEGNVYIFKIFGKNTFVKKEIKILNQK